MGSTGTGSIVDTASGEIAPTSNLSINATGSVDLGGYNETVATLGMTGGSTLSNSSSGELAVSSGMVTTSPNSQTATINGNLLLPGTTPTFNVGGGQGGSPDLLVNGTINDSNTGTSLDKSGTGIIRFGSSTIVPGQFPIEVLDGELDFNGAASTNPVTVSQGATLGGTGTLGAVTSNGGTVQPGDYGSAGTGTLNVGGLTLNAGSSNVNSTLPVQLSSGTSFGQILSSGNIALNGVNLEPTAGSSFTSNGGNSYDVLGNTSGTAATGTFANLGSGQSITIPGVSNVQFQGNYASGTSGQDFSLAAYNNSQITLQPSLTSSVYGQPITLTANLGGNSTATGTVNFLSGTTNIGSATLTNGSAVLSNLGSLPVGADSITAVYSGDSSNASSTSSAVNVQVSQASSNAALSASANPVQTGQSTTLSAAVTPVSPSGGSPTGMVTFMLGSTVLGQGPISNGAATLDVPSSSLNPGPNTITAVYSGDGNFTAAPVATFSLYDGVVSTTGTLATSTASTTYGAPIALTATLTPATTEFGSPDGSVAFYAGSTELGTAPLSGGTAVLNLNSLPLGSNQVTAVYAGDNTFSSITTAAVGVQIAAGATAVSLAPEMNPAPFGQPIMLTATVTPATPSTLAPSGLVAFIVNGTPVAASSVTNGVATLMIPFMNTGSSESISAEYLGQAGYSGSTSASASEAVVKATPETTIEKRIIRSHGRRFGVLIFSVTPSAGTTAGPTGDVKVLRDGRAFKALPLSQGFAVLGAGKARGGVIQALYLGDTNYNSSVSGRKRL